MERRRSSSSPSQPPPPCQRSPHNFSFDLRRNPACSHFTPYYSNYSHHQVNLGKPVYRPRFQGAEKSSRKPRGEEDYSADHNDDSSSERASKNSSRKALLYELCAAYKWKPPLFDCHREEGPSHLKRFIFKAVVEIKGNAATVVEAFSEPRSSKKSAAEHAAEGALWYLKHLGYVPQKK